MPKLYLGTNLSLRLYRLLFAVLLAAMVLAAFHFDGAADGWVRTHPDARASATAGALSHYGDWPFLMAYGVVGGVVCKMLNRRRWMRIVCLMMLSSSVAGIAVNVVRLTAGRARPNAEVEPGWYGPRYQGRWTGGSNKFHAFPSGHTAAAVGFAMPLLILTPEAGAPVLLMALLVAGSRVYLRAHHLSDVTVAAIMAAIVAAELTRRWQARHP